MLKTVLNNKQGDFEDEVYALLKEGFKLSSSSCNTYQFEDYPEEAGS